MHLHHTQFTIRSLMIAVVIVAGMLALPGGWREVAAVLLLPCLALFTAWRLLVGGHRRLAAIAFWSLAIPVNVLFAALCASVRESYPQVYSSYGYSSFCPRWLGSGPHGPCWRRGGAEVPRPSRQWAWMWVIALAVMPGVTAWTVWPFRLEFLAARSALERVADQIAAGQAVSFPQSAGPFRLAASRVDPQTGGVALLIDPNPNGPGGFVRHKVSLTGPYNCHARSEGIGGTWDLAADGVTTRRTETEPVRHSMKP